MSEVKAVAWLLTWPDNPGLGSLLSEEPPSDSYTHGEPLVPESALAALRDELSKAKASVRFGLATQDELRVEVERLQRASDAAIHLWNSAMGELNQQESRAARLEADNARLREGLGALAAQMRSDANEDEATAKKHDAGSPPHASLTASMTVARIYAEMVAALTEKEGGDG